MTTKKTIAVLIVAAGSGTRFGGTMPKQYQPLLGKPVMRWSLDVFKNHPLVDNVFVVIQPEHLPYYQHATKGLALPTPIIGGASRQESVRLGLEALAKIAKPDLVLIHDAARPAVTIDLIDRVCAGLEHTTAAAPGLPIADTVRRIVNGASVTENRDGLHAIQTPQGFAFDTILDLHRQYKDAVVTDDCALMDMAGQKTVIVDGDRNNIKITEGSDFALMEQHLSNRLGDIRTGQGYDVHRLIDPPHQLHRLKIGGVEIMHDKVLEGHSDADVALHAITDALLATICDGDIGVHFSPKDARWKNADSAQFLQHAANLVLQQGGAISHVDVTVICESPKISPHRAAIRARIGEILNLPQSRISVKATTTEGLGFTGRKEGIAAQSVVTVRLPFGVSASEQFLPITAKAANA